MTDKDDGIMSFTFILYKGIISVTEISPVQISSSMKVCEVIKRLEADGWYIDRTKCNHRQFKHPNKLDTVTVSGKPSVDVPIGTLNNIWRQVQFEAD